VPAVHVIAASRLGSPAGAIVSAADLGLVDPGGTWVPANLIVMATHGRGGVGRWLYGSVASYVLPRVHAPVLLVHPRLADG
jgi:nucleotide-binding universal stress UspA family protein